MEDIVIVSAARTAVGKFGGSLAKTSGARARRASSSSKLLERARRAAATRSAKSSWARCSPPASGQNPARQALDQGRPARMSSRR